MSTTVAAAEPLRPRRQPARRRGARHADGQPRRAAAPGRTARSARRAGAAGRGSAACTAFRGRHRDGLGRRLQRDLLPRRGDGARRRAPAVLRVPPRRRPRLRRGLGPGRTDAAAAARPRWTGCCTPSGPAPPEPARVRRRCRRGRSSRSGDAVLPAHCRGARGAGASTATGRSAPSTPATEAAAVTPASVRAALAAGYRPVLHPSAAAQLQRAVGRGVPAAGEAVAVGVEAVAVGLRAAGGEEGALRGVRVAVAAAAADAGDAGADGAVVDPLADRVASLCWA